jgi:glycosyltransferase involved in cell wall biosynthesis
LSKQPFYSVIVPAHNAAEVLPTSLAALEASDLPRERWELIVVDDGSSDDTASVSARYADTVVTMPGRAHGPAYARNRGFEVSRGDIVVFLDSDVVVRPNVLSRFAAIFESQPDVGGVLGSYDDQPADRGFMSQFRNLTHHFVHQRNAGEVFTFWAGAGAVRREVFAEAGMYDEWHYPRPQIEDLELGARIRGTGKRILLDPEIQVNHLKRWTLRDVVRTDLRDRGIPRARLLAQRGDTIAASALKLPWAEKLNTALVWAAWLLLLLSLVIGNRYLAAIAGACLVTVVLAIGPLWYFFAGVRGWWFAVRVIPAQLLFYTVNGVSIGIGRFLQFVIGPPIPDPTIEAFAEVGVKSWPPVPRRNKQSSWAADE